jgi:hypothetical protein
MPLIGTEFQEIPHFGSGVSPLFPIAHTNPAANPLINPRDRTIVLCNSKVIYPTSNVLTKLHHPVIHGYSPTSASEFPDTPLKLLKRLIGPTDFTALKSKAEKCASLNRYYLTFLFVYE